MCIKYTFSSHKQTSQIITNHDIKSQNYSYNYSLLLHLENKDDSHNWDVFVW